MLDKKLRIGIIAGIFLLLFVLLYNLPPIHNRISWRVDEWKLRVQYAMNPPEEVVFKPQSTLNATPTPLPSQTLTSTTTAVPSPTSPLETLAPTPTSVPLPTPIPAKVELQGIKYEDQHDRWNYCAPANLAMALSFWDWKGDKNVVGPQIKPDPKDKNVMPYEMADYIEQETDLKVVVRSGGNIETLKRFIAAGFPVMVEKGVYFRDISGIVSWMGHYEVFNGYDDAEKVLIGQDSFVGADQRSPYESVEKGWRSFNNIYLVIYPPAREVEVMTLLEENADETINLQNAAQKASEEIYLTTGIDQFFAWYNRGTSLMQLQDYSGAALAYDQAFSIYPSISEKERPWRMLWYQTGPYFAYFYVGRYYDVIALADQTLNSIQTEKNLEESYYWRGMARASLGDTSGAAEDYRFALQYHPNFGPALYQLGQLGVAP